MQNSAKIRELNDAFRKSFVGGRVMLTAGVNVLELSEREAVLRKVRDFVNFNPDNDPYEEHDFVAIEHDGKRYFAKIDYYAPDLQHGAENPADPETTVRVLTVMRADEY